MEKPRPPMTARSKFMREILAGGLKHLSKEERLRIHTSGISGGLKTPFSVISPVTRSRGVASKAGL
jgi:hypothetical protein